MHTKAKRGRGRPPGPGKDDSRELNAVADLLLATPRLRPTTAYRRVIKNATPADLRRFQDKWKDEKDALMAAAKARADTKVAHSLAPPREPGQSYAGASFSMRALVREVIDNPVARKLREFEDNPINAKIRELRESPIAVSLRALEGQTRLAQGLPHSRAQSMIDEIENYPSMRMMRELEDSPAMRAIRDIENSPAMRMVRELENSPAMQMERELDRWRF